MISDKLPVVEVIHFQGQLYNDLPDLWGALHQSYNTIADHSVDIRCSSH